MTPTIRCSKCGEEHEVSETAWGFDRPALWDLLTDEQRADSELGEEQCIIQAQGTHFFIRACLEIPIQGSQRPFVWGVWCSLSEKSMREMAEHWNDPERTKLGPYFGWLNTKLPWYPDTLSLKTQVHQRAVGLRPFVELEQTDHPLAVHQRDGLDQETVAEIVACLLHTGAHPAEAEDAPGP